MNIYRDVSGVVCTQIAQAGMHDMVSCVLLFLMINNDTENQVAVISKCIIHIQSSLHLHACHTNTQGLCGLGG
jgi:hypothetical protein